MYNYLEQIWYYGTIERSAWLDTPLREYPQAANGAAGSTTGYVYSQESGVDADGVAMESYVQSSDFDIGDGDQFMLTRRLIPDVGFTGSTADAPEVSVELRTRNFPGSDFSVNSENSQRVIANTVGVYTNQVFIRARARQMAFKISSEVAGVQWQCGAPRIDVRPDGRKT